MARRNDPYLNFNFLVELGGDIVGGFSEADLPAGRIEAVAYRGGAYYMQNPEGGTDILAPNIGLLFIGGYE